MPKLDAYSFVAWVASLAVYICFLLWAFLPSEMLDAVGITYYPNRYYAIALPSYVIVVYVVISVSYTAYNMLNTVDPTDFRSFRDEEGNHEKASVVCQSFDIANGMPDVGDIDPLELSQLWKWGSCESCDEAQISVRLEL